jgi:site-specific recombinase XerD
MENLEKHIEEWLDFAEKSWTSSTYLTYRCVIHQLLHHIEQNGQKLSEKAIENFLNAKYQSGGSRRQYNAYLIITRTFCGWREKRYDIKSPAHNIQRIRERKAVVRCLSEEEFKLAVQSVDGIERDIILFLGSSGLRRNEFRCLKWKNIDPSLRFMRIIGKGNKMRIIPINQTIKRILLKYQRLGDEESLQISSLYPGMESASWLCAKISRRIEIPKFGVHAIRHYFATTLIRKGLSIFIISKLLGHSSVLITQNAYIHIISEDLYGKTDILDDLAI